MAIATKKKRVSTRTRPKTPTPMGTTEQELSLHSLNMLLDGFLFNLSLNCEIFNYYLSDSLKLADDAHKYAQIAGWGLFSKQQA